MKYLWAHPLVPNSEMCEEDESKGRIGEAPQVPRTVLEAREKHRVEVEASCERKCSGTDIFLQRKQLWQN